MTRDPLIGLQLANFRIERLLDRGGMALVYYGWDVKLERPVAIKLIDAQYRDDPSYAERFVREARAVAAWQHESIVRIYYADDQDGLYYFVMEYIDGVDLGKLLAWYADENRLVRYDDVLLIGQSVADALDFAHQQGVIHRDVKPANVMVTDQDRVILTDFGLAMDVRHGSLGNVFGSSTYIAPEQARRSADAVPQSDLYALGVILYQMLTGVVPFQDPSPTSVALQHCTLPPPPPRDLNPNLSAEVEAVLLKALSKAPEDRYQTGGALMEALKRALHTSLPSFAGAMGTDSTGPVLSRVSMRERVASHIQAQSALARQNGQGQETEQADPRSHDALSSRSTDDMIGQQLDEYRLDMLLGQGGMARVYRGTDVNLDRPVAIKVIDTPFRTNADYMARFRREAKAIAKLEHPHIVRLYRYGESDGLLYMAMQYIEGIDLGSVLADCRRDRVFMAQEKICRIAHEIGLALDYAHEQGVIHRDVKPSNIMLDGQENAVLADFGLALLTDVGTRGEIFGSPRYIAPEQAISSANVVSQSDLYSLGVILYEMLTSRLPFDADDSLDVAMLHMSEPPPSPRQVRPELNSELEAVILKALAKEPEERYQSGVELADALRRALESDFEPLTLPLEPAAPVAEDLPLPLIPAAVVAAPAQQAESSEPTHKDVPRRSKLARLLAFWRHKSLAFYVTMILSMVLFLFVLVVVSLLVLMVVGVLPNVLTMTSLLR